MEKALKKKDLLKSQRGQIVLEYVLLLVIGVVVAALITETLVQRNESSPGFLMVKWKRIIETIGNDRADDIDEDLAGGP